MGSKDIFKKTQKRIIITCIGIVLICIILFSIITLTMYQKRVYSLVDQQLSTYKNTILTSQDIIKESGGETKVILPPPFTPNIISFVWDSNELVNESMNNTLREGIYPNFPDETMNKSINIKIEENVYRGVTFEHKGLNIQLIINVNYEISSIKQLTNSLVTSLIVIISIVLFLARYLAFLVIKPIKQSYNQQVHFIQDASHEMRTPLAVIKGTLEIMGKYLKEPIEEHIDELSQVMAEIRGLEKLNSDLLLLSKEDLQIDSNISKIEVTELINELREFYQYLSEFQNKNLKIIIQQKSIWVEWDKEKVKRCITILLENAFRYTAEGDTIEVMVDKKDKWINIVVKDSGIGIKEEDVKRLFDRFFRSNDVRARGIDGSGIGLSLLKSLCHTTGSKINVLSVYNKGSEFTLSIPVYMK